MKASSLRVEVLFLENINFNSYFYCIPAIQVALWKSCRYDKISILKEILNYELFICSSEPEQNVLISEYLTTL